MAHNIATSHVTRAFRLRRQQFVTLDDLPTDVVGTSRAAVAMKVHRIKRLLARQFNEGVTHDR